MARNLTNSQVNVIPHNHDIVDVNGLQTVLNSKADSSSVPTKTSDLTNDSKFVVSTSLATVATSGNYSDLNGKPSIDTEMSDTSTHAVQNKIIKQYVDNQSSSAAQGAVSDATYASSWNGVTSVAPSKNAVYDKINAMDSAIANKADASSLKTVATTGDYNDLTNKPTIGNATITFQKNGTLLKTITTNQTTNDTINITVPVKTSEITNDSGFITKSVSDLTNYYTKTQTYTKDEINSLINSFGGFQVVSTLPTSDIKTNVIYLLGPIGSGTDKYQEWIYTTQWVLIGDTSVDLTNYMTSTQIATAIENAVEPLEEVKQDKATSGNGAPSTTPTYVGQQYVDKTNNYLYVAVGTSSSSDWYLVGENTGVNVEVLTQNEYDALTETQKNGETIYLIKATGGEGAINFLQKISTSPLDVQYIWAGTDAEYKALGSYSSNCLYITVD